MLSAPTLDGRAVSNHNNTATARQAGFFTHEQAIIASAKLPKDQVTRTWITFILPLSRSAEPPRPCQMTICFAAQLVWEGRISVHSMQH